MDRTANLSPPPTAVPVHLTPVVVVQPDGSPTPDHSHNGAYTNEATDHTTNTQRDVIHLSMDDDAGSSREVSRRVCGSAASSASDSDTADDAPLLQNDGRVRIDMPGDKPSSLFPKERGKAMLAVTMLVIAAILNEVTLSFVHEKVPDTDPLPDVVFSHTPYYPKGLEICEYIMMVSFVSVLVLILFHRHRWIVLRRLMLLGCLLYLMRCVTMFVTQVPVADTNFHCSPKYGENGTFWRIVVRGLSMVTGVGLNVQGQNTLCGDYIYSGHTIVLVVSALFMGEYSPRRWWIIHYIYWVVAFVGVVFLVVSRGHYTVDVIISYYVVTRLFWNYHTMAAHPTLRTSHHNHHRKEYWFPLFAFMESGLQKPVPRRFDSPIPLETIRSFFRRRQINSRIE